MRLSLLIGLLAVSVPLVAGAQKVYKWVGPDGKISYSDKPQPGAEQIRIPEVQTLRAPPVPTRGEGEEEPAEAQGYEQFLIIFPANNEPVRDNAGNVMVQLEIQPGLVSGHTIDLVMDGRRLGGSGQTTQVMLNNVDRGSHTVQAIILGQDGEEVARSNSVTFHLQRVVAPRARPRS